MNGTIIVDKPAGWTSSDVVCKLRGVLRERRIGHSGTLDPMATGVLPVFVGRATRAVEFCEADDKEYVAGLLLGETTDTQDITGSVLSESEEIPNREAVEETLARFRGRISQLPPMYSAVKVGGKKLYELARKGVEAERKPREIEIKTLELLEGGGREYTLRVVCSKGTYIRTLCHDIGMALGCGGVMSSLRRVRAGAFRIENAVTLSEILEAAEKGEAETLLHPVDELFAAYPAHRISGKAVKRCLCGNAIPAPGLADGRFRVYEDTGRFLMLGEVKNGEMLTVKSFFEELS